MSSGDATPVRTLGLLVGGRSVASETGRTYPVADTRHVLLAHVALASRKDVRDAVVAASAGAQSWSATPAHRRGYALHRVVETLHERRTELVDAVAAAEGVPGRRATALVAAALERWEHHAGWADKLGAVLGTGTAEWGRLRGDTTPEPVGVAAVLAPQSSSLLGLVSVLAPVLATGCTCVLVASQDRPLPALVLAGAVVAAGLPDGVVNVLTGRTAELAPWLAGHRDVQAVDLCGAPAAQRVDLEQVAAGSVKRVLAAPSSEPDWSRPPEVGALRRLLEPRTVWRPLG
ncbi:aldehyde dehydrogenase family protein [Rhodococcus antarcticus]|jgi:acyl-CoA reductase-like NAD-dependent aldehyde dehydrogenase|uniref:Aldehyde dehydrogenase family protein n=1 Tax=Rhodococcus antarcticus TaxID=2987751 RepID=A0ABY6P1A3_9NOCA|nr:aldehyde dehydrogenase family protein [Rhodococcus antarcticus]UZJ25432.1 aldehyde dehydrogenase family protein [Rhodococcus antarcticus]